MQTHKIERITMINIIDIDPKYLEGIQLDVIGVGINEDEDYSCHILINIEDLTISYNEGKSWRPITRSKTFDEFNSLF